MDGDSQQVSFDTRLNKCVHRVEIAKAPNPPNGIIVVRYRSSALSLSD
jgi:hypothetical protein